MLHARVKGRTCIKYKRPMRIVETDCALAATKHFSSRVINGIARYFMRLLLRVCSQTDRGVSFSMRGRCEPIKYRDGAPTGNIYLAEERRTRRGSKKSVNVAKYQALFKVLSITSHSISHSLRWNIDFYENARTRYL